MSATVTKGVACKGLEWCRSTERGWGWRRLAWEIMYGGSRVGHGWQVVYHLYGQTGKSTVWENGTQISWLVRKSSRGGVYHLYKSVPFTRKRPRRPETGTKDGFEGMKHEFLFGTFHPEKQDYLFTCSVVLWHFPLERLKKKIICKWLTTRECINFVCLFYQSRNVAV